MSLKSKRIAKGLVIEKSNTQRSVTLTLEHDATNANSMVLKVPSLAGATTLELPNFGSTILSDINTVSLQNKTIDANLNTITNLQIAAANVNSGVATLGTVLTANGSGGASWQNAGSGANTTLSNLLSPTSINQDLIPSATFTRNLGSSSFYWNNVYLGSIFSTLLRPSTTVVTFTGDLNSTSTILVADTTGLSIGQQVIGTGIPDFAFITAINPNVSITISPAATATNTGVTLKAAFTLTNRTADQTTSEPSGFITLRSGNTTTEQSGSLIVRSGTTTTGQSGTLNIQSGNSTSGNSGNINIFSGTTSGTRGTINITGNAISLNGLGQPLNINSSRITNVLDPSSNQDAATKNYVDGIASSINTSIDNALGLIVGTTAQVTAGLADYDSLQSAITAASTGGRITVLNGVSLTETITLNKRLTIIGVGGYDSYINGTVTLQSGSDFSMIKLLRANQFIFNSGADGNQVVDCFWSTNPTDSGTGNLYSGVNIT